jgi:hypothetical protein
MTWTPLPPIEVLLSWPAKSEHAELRGSEQYIVTAIFGSIAAAAVSFRLYTRFFTRNFFGIDDYLILLAAVGLDTTETCSRPPANLYQLAATGVEVCITLGKAKYAWDRHLWDWDLSLTKGTWMLNMMWEVH